MAKLFRGRYSRKILQDQELEAFHNVFSNRDDTKAQLSNKFHWKIWIMMTIINWVLEFGRPCIASVTPVRLFSANRPGMAEYIHMIYNVSMPFCLFKLLDKRQMRSFSILPYLAIIIFVMGSTIHLVTASLCNKALGHQLVKPIGDNPTLKNLDSHRLVNTFELIYYYDKNLGYPVWFIPFYASLFIYFMDCFIGKNKYSEQRKGLCWLFLVITNAIYYWYNVAQSQLFIAYFTFYMAMFLWWRKQRLYGLVMNTNGQFLFFTSTLTLILIGIWVIHLWKDPILRKRYPGFIYIPEPWTYYNLYLKHNGTVA